MCSWTEVCKKFETSILVKQKKLIFIFFNSKSGKTTFVTELLNNSSWMIDKPLHKVYWIAGDENALPKNLSMAVEYLYSIPDEFENKTGLPCLVVIDDSMLEAEKKSIVNLLTKTSHHRNLSVIFLTQNIFAPSKYGRTISLNFSHFAIMKNPRDKNQFSFFCRQLYPENSKELLRVYKEMTILPYSYIFIDVTQCTHNLFRFRSDIFNKNYGTVYCSQIPSVINNVPVKHEEINQGSIYTACFAELEV